MTTIPPGTGARAALLAVLSPLGYPVVDGRWPANVTRSTLTVRTQEVRPTGTGRMRTWEMVVTVLTAYQAAGADDDLDTVLGRVLDALDDAQPVQWVNVARVTVDNDAYNAHDVTVTVTLQKV